jgi:hypothetical protein
MTVIPYLNLTDLSTDLGLMLHLVIFIRLEWALATTRDTI